MIYTDKISLTLKAYWLSRRAIKRQYHRGQIDQTRDTKLRRLVRYCYENIKYYRETFERANVRPDDINSAEDIYKLPLLTKQQFRDRLWDFLSRSYFKTK